MPEPRSTPPGRAVVKIADTVSALATVLGLAFLFIAAAPLGLKAMLVVLAGVIWGARLSPPSFLFNALSDKQIAMRCAWGLTLFMATPALGYFFASVT